MQIEDKRRLYNIASSATWVAGSETQAILTKDELHNLTIDYGTLTIEEREVVNHHINATVAMLAQIKFPKHLKNVPEYAGGHHERIDGKGYPNGLTREQMSIQARVMAIADIFEALTADDRPYKTAKTLSEALFILNRMQQKGHIDPDLYNVFIEKKVYLHYADQFLTYFKITADALNNMQNKGLDEKLLNSLAVLVDQSIKGEDDFLQAIQQQIGLSAQQKYRELFLTYSKSVDQPQIDVD
jgi:hypothetical protein